MRRNLLFTPTQKDLQTKPVINFNPLYKALQYQFKRPQLLQEALTRRSAVEEGVANAAHRDYQRLEYLGDRVINFIVMLLLVKRFPAYTEEQWQNLAVLCTANSEILPRIGTDLLLENYLIRGAGEIDVTEKMYADAVEAIFGAIYADAEDLNTVVEIVERLWDSHITSLLETENVSDDDTKSTASTNDGYLTRYYIHYGNSSDKNDDFSELLSSRLRISERSHFDSGIYRFRKIVLGWELDTIHQPLPCMRYTDPVPPAVQKYTVYSRSEYYKRFRNLVLEETRAIIANGLMAGKVPTLQLRYKEFKAANNQENPSSFTFTAKLPPHYDSGVSSIAVLLEPIGGNEDERLLGLASYTEREEMGSIKIFKILSVVPYSYDLYSDHFDTDRPWKASILGGLTTQTRIFDVCSKQPNFGFEEPLMLGQLELSEIDESENEAAGNTINHLNDSQKVAVHTFLSLKSGLQLIQGPPGTGKTTTILALLSILYQQEKRVLVSAPSNKAVQILASRFLQQYPDAAITLAGVKSKLAPELSEIFLHDWGKTVCHKVSDVLEIIEKLLITEDEMDSKNVAQLINTLKNQLKQLYHFSIRYEDSPKNYHETSWYELIRETKAAIEQGTNAKPFFEQLKIRYEEILLETSNLMSSTKKNPIPALEKYILEKAKVIFATLSVCGRKSLQEMSPVDVLIIDEAGQSLEAESLIPFALKPKQCLLVGDPKQLPALVLSPTAIKKHYDWSLMHRLSEACDQSPSLLTTQYRMDPEIRSWPSKQYYQGRLVDHPSVLQRESSLKNPLLPCSFVNVEAREHSRGFSCENKKEANWIIQILRYMKINRIDLSTQVGIITFYAAQVALIKSTLKQAHLANAKVSTVDAFQGDEKDYIIISCVRANPKGKIGFVSDFRRLNVAITRAKLGLIMLGNIRTLEQKRSDIAILIDNMRERGHLWEEGILGHTLKVQSTQSRGRKKKSCHFFQKGNCRNGIRCQFLHNMSPSKNRGNRSLASYRISPPIIEKRYQHLFHKIGYAFNNIDLLLQALTRQSAIEEGVNKASTSTYHSLMLVGDRLIKLVLGKELYLKFPNASEGDLHNKEEPLLSIKTVLSKIAMQLGLHRYLIKGQGEDVVSARMRADTLKALIAAIYLDTNDLRCVTQVVKKLWKNQLKHLSPLPTPIAIRVVKASGTT